LNLGRLDDCGQISRFGQWDDLLEENTGALKMLEPPLSRIRHFVKAMFEKSFHTSLQVSTQTLATYNAMNAYRSGDSSYDQATE